MDPDYPAPGQRVDRYAKSFYALFMLDVDTNPDMKRKNHSQDTAEGNLSANQRSRVADQR